MEKKITATELLRLLAADFYQITATKTKVLKLPRPITAPKCWLPLPPLGLVCKAVKEMLYRGPADNQTIAQSKVFNLSVPRGQKIKKSANYNFESTEDGLVCKGNVISRPQPTDQAYTY